MKKTSTRSVKRVRDLEKAFELACDYIYDRNECPLRDRRDRTDKDFMCDSPEEFPYCDPKENCWEKYFLWKARKCHES